MKRTDETMSTYFTASFSAYDVKCCLSQKFQSQDKKRKKEKGKQASLVTLFSASILPPTLYSTKIC